MADYFNRRNLLIGGAVLVGGLVIYAVTSSGGGNSGGTVTYAPARTDPAIVAANTQLQLASMQLNAQANQTQAQLAMSAQDNQARLALAELSASIERGRLENEVVLGAASLGVQARGNELNANLARYNIDAQVMLNNNNNNFQLDYAQIAANTSIAISAQNAATMQSILSAEAARDQARFNAMQNIEIAQIAGQVRTTELQVQNNANRLDFLGSNLSQLNRRNRDDILYVVAGGDAGHKYAPTDLQGIAGVVSAAGDGIRSLVGWF